MCENKNIIEFRETQKLGTGLSKIMFIIICIIGLPLILGIIFTREMDSISTAVPLIISMLPLGALIEGTLFRYNLELREDGIYYKTGRSLGFKKSFNKILYSEIVSCYKDNRYAKKYGYRIQRSSYGRTIIMGGNDIIKIELTNGKVMLLGTMKADEFLRAVENNMNLSEEEIFS